MGNWSKVPALQIAASLEKMAWQERELSIDNALKKFDRALVQLTFQHSICILEDLRGLLGSHDLPVFVLFSLSLFSIFSHVSIFFSFSFSLEAIHSEDFDRSSYCMVDMIFQLYFCDICSVKVILSTLVFSALN